MNPHVLQLPLALLLGFTLAVDVPAQSPPKAMINLAELTDWNEVIFANILRQARNWWEEDVNRIPRRDNLTNPDPVTGLPRSLPTTAFGQSHAVTVIVPDNSRGFVSGPHVLKWNGAATIRIEYRDTSGTRTSQVLASNPALGVFGRIALNLRNDDTIRIAIEALPSPTTQPLADLRLTSAGEEFTYTGLSQAFKNAWQGKIAGVRLMDAQHINNSDVTKWNERRPDGFWTESDARLESYRFTTSSWPSPTVLQLGDELRFGDLAGSVGRGIVVALDNQVNFRVFRIQGSLPAPGSKVYHLATANFASVAQAPIMHENARGCAVQTSIDICNELGVRAAWFCVPEGVDDNYVTQYATQLRGGLNAAVTSIFFEYSNETWNPLFRAYSYCNSRGVALNLPGANPWEKGAQFYALRASQIHALGRSVFSANPTRLVRVFAGQNANGEYWYRYRTIANPYGSSPTAYPADVWAVAPYFGDNIVDSNFPSPATDQALYNLCLTDAMDSLAGASGQSPYRNGGLGLHALLATERLALQGFPCAVGCYEGGQHTVVSQPANITRMKQFQNTTTVGASMGLLYAQYLAACVNGYGAPVFLYNSGTSWGANGFWGAYEHLSDNLLTQQKYQAIINF